MKLPVTASKQNHIFHFGKTKKACYFFLPFHSSTLSISYQKKKRRQSILIQVNSCRFH